MNRIIFFIAFNGRWSLHDATNQPIQTYLNEQVNLFINFNMLFSITLINQYILLMGLCWTKAKIN